MIEGGHNIVPWSQEYVPKGSIIKVLSALVKDYWGPLRAIYGPCCRSSYGAFIHAILAQERLLAPSSVK